MTDGDGTLGNADPHGDVVFFCRRWHVINELDLVRLLAGHRELETLCDLLEACADALPGRPSPAQSAVICEKLAAIIHRYEYGGMTLLDGMFRRDPARPLATALLDHIDARNAADSANAQDLIAALDPLSGETGRFPAGMLGYMLRGFFEGCRRAMDFTELAILTLGDTRLTPDARALLTDSLQRYPVLRERRPAPTAP